MNAGDEFLATIRVYYTGGNTCGGGREFEDVANAVHNFDEADFDSLVPVPKALPTYIGARVSVYPERRTTGNYHSFVAMLAAPGNRWVTTCDREGLRELTTEKLQEMDWEALS